MKTAMAAAFVACFVMGTHTASAEVRAVDPSGAPMCFTDAGDKAPLTQCAGLFTEGLSYQLRTDPSGAPMCFSTDGQLQPLAHCLQFKALTQPSRLINDPSGAPQCFDAVDRKAPLSRCSFRLQVRAAVLRRVLSPEAAARGLVAALD